MTRTVQSACRHALRSGLLSRITHAILVSAIFTWAYWYTPAVCAATVQNFDRPGTFYSIRQCSTPARPPPTEMCCGPNGKFLRLTSTATANHNTIAFDRTDARPLPEVMVGFDFRITPGTGRASGLGFALLDTAVYGTSGSVCPPQAAEEPNFIRSLGVGFDTDKHGRDSDNNHVSIHFNGAVVGQFTVPIPLASGQWIHAQIIMRPGLGLSDVSVILAPRDAPPVTVVSSLHVPGFMPYVGRVFFGARASGTSTFHDLDNVHVQFIHPAVHGRWDKIINAQIIGIHMHLLPTGQVMYWEDKGQTDEIRVWDPATGIISTPALPGEDIFCSGHTFMADGKLFVAGGHITDSTGLPSAHIYDPVADSWRRLPDMVLERWYPTNTLLANGDVLVVAGDIVPGLENPLAQVWQTAQDTWHYLADLRSVPNYPWMFLTTNGKVFHAGPNDDTCYLDPAGKGTWECARPYRTAFASLRGAGSAVMYDDNKILIVGGGNIQQPPSKTAEVIDLNAANPAWRYTRPMAYARIHFNATLLPDGTVLVTSGTGTHAFNDATDAVLAAERWNPATEVWSTMASMQFKRLYHSSALLLPDGRVMVGGGGQPPPEGETDRQDFEIFSPPYLFKGKRPTITLAPLVVSYGQTFLVQTPEAASIRHVNWLRLPSVTHGFDENQRLNRLSFAPRAGGLYVTVPTNPNLTPPGHYMLFLLNQNGVPSVAQIIQVSPKGRRCARWRATQIGTAGDDLMVGTEDDDVIVGLGGNDIIVGGGGHDVLCGDDGDDILLGESGDDVLYGEAGHDILDGGDGNDVLLGGDGDDWLLGGAGDDFLAGEEGDDGLNGGAGTDVCDGGPQTVRDTGKSTCERTTNVP